MTKKVKYIQKYRMNSSANGKLNFTGEIFSTIYVEKCLLPFLWKSTVEL